MVNRLIIFHVFIKIKIFLQNQKVLSLHIKNMAENIFTRVAKPSDNWRAKNGVKV